MRKLKIIFMGSPEFAVPSLRTLTESSHQVLGIVTQPDKIRGRGKKLIPTAVKKAAQDLNINTVFQPESLKDDDFIGKVKAINADLFVVVAFRILPEALFTLPPLGTINVHPSLLPKYRGAAPLNWTIINGEQETGVTIMKITRQIDAGQILKQQKAEVRPDETAGELHDRLAELGTDLLLETVNGLAADTIKPIPQQDWQATPAPKITKEMCHLSFDQPAVSVKNRIHGLSPRPAAFAYYQGNSIKFYRARVADQDFTGKVPGTIVQASGGALKIGCRPGIIEILEIQKEGRSRMAAKEFLKGFRFKEGEQFV